MKHSNKPDAMAKFMASVTVLSKDAESKLRGGYAAVSELIDETDNGHCTGTNKDCTNTSDCKGSDNTNICKNQGVCFS